VTSGRSGRGGCSLPDEVTSLLGGAGGVDGDGRPAPGRAGAGGGGTRRAGAGPDAAAAAGRSAGGVAGGAGGGAADAAGATGSGSLAGVSAAGATVGPEAAGASASADFLAAVFFAAAFFAGAVFAGAFAAGAVSAGVGSGCLSRTSPSRWARRRTRSACASSMPEECVLTPMPNLRQRSRHSLLVSPSSLASSWTLVFAAKFSLTSPSSCSGRDPRTSWRTSR